MVGVQVCCFEYRPARHLYGSFLSRKRHVSVSFPGHVPTHCPTLICCWKRNGNHIVMWSSVKKFKYRWCRNTIRDKKDKGSFLKNAQNFGNIQYINVTCKLNFSWYSNIEFIFSNSSFLFFSCFSNDSNYWTISYSDHRSHVGRVCALLDRHFAVIQHGLHMVHPVTITGATAFLHHLVDFITLKT